MTRSKTIVLDDDPTGTQSASGVLVLFDATAEELRAALTDHDSVYVLTNTRALDEAAAVGLLSRIRRDAEAVARELGVSVRFVLRGDSTLRGHVFAETDVFLSGDAVMLFVPAYPEAGRVTLEGVHYVTVGGRRVPASETEYAADPVFPFDSARLTEYVADKGRGRVGVHVPLGDVRSGALARVLEEAAPGAVVLPDVAEPADVARIASAVAAAEEAGRTIVVRSGSPLAARLAGVQSEGLLPVQRHRGRVLLVCGSHTDGATAQLAAVASRWPRRSEIDTDAAYDDPRGAGLAAAEEVRGQDNPGGAMVLMSGRRRRRADNTLRHGELVMTALTTAVAALMPRADVVIAKGGITSADVARAGIGATSAWVEGQLATGISLWRVIARDGRSIPYAVVPGNVGGPSTLVDVIDALTGGS